MNQVARTQSLPRIPDAGEVSVAARAGTRIRSRSRRTQIAFMVLVVIPTVLTALYTGLLATPRYVSEAQFVVSGLSSVRASGLDALFQTFGISRTVDDSNIVENYVVSRDAMKALEGRISLRAMFQRADIDRLARYPRPWEWESDEEFYKYYQDRVYLVQDPAKGILTLKVYAFSAEDAKKIADNLLLLAEDLANRMNQRALNDSVGSAAKVVKDAEHDLVVAQAALTDFRNKYLLVDPTQDSQLQLQMMTALSLDYARAHAAMKQSSLTAASNPTIASLKAQSDALRERIALERTKLAGNDQALAGKVSEYERLTLDRDLANTQLSAAVTTLQLAQQDATRRLIYVEQVVAPNLPDESTEPQFLRTTATAFVLGFAIFATLWIVTVGAQEHEQ